MVVLFYEGLKKANHSIGIAFITQIPQAYWTGLISLKTSSFPHENAEF